MNSARNQWNSTCYVSSCEYPHLIFPASLPIWNQLHTRPQGILVVRARCHADGAADLPCFASYSPFQTLESRVLPLFETPKSEQLETDSNHLNALVSWADGFRLSFWIFTQYGNLHKKNKYDEAWIKNFINGFRISFPLPQSGAIIYITQYTGKNTTTRKIISNFSVDVLRRKPGTPSYQSAASNCWMFGWATNWNQKTNRKWIWNI